MNKNGEKAGIREVYQITTRLEEKIDILDRRVANIEGKASIIAIVWASVISLIGITFGYFIKK